MAKFFIKQKVFSARSQFTLKNESDEDCFTVIRKWSLQKSLLLKDMQGFELAQIQGPGLHNIYVIYQDGVHSATLRHVPDSQETRLSIEGPNWDIVGDWKASDYSITDMDGGIHAIISSEPRSWGDSYCIDFRSDEPGILLLATVIAIADLEYYLLRENTYSVLLPQA